MFAVLARSLSTFIKDDDYQVVDLVVVEFVVDREGIAHGHSRPMDFKDFCAKLTKKVQVALIIFGELEEPPDVHGAGIY